jgi:hypothetical protein
MSTIELEKAKATLEEHFGTQEDLLPELQKHLSEFRGMPMLRHPLVFSMFHMPQLNHTMNQCLLRKQEQIKEAIKNRDLSQIVWLHERPCRFDAFIEYYKEFEPHIVAKVLTEIWTDAESPGINNNHWGVYFAMYADEIMQHGMEKQDRAVFNMLPDPLVIYRGCGPQYKRAFSWTLCSMKAKWFASRWSDHGGPKNGKVFTSTIHKKDALCYLNNREEKEIIVHPRIRKTMKITEVTV